MTVRPGEHITVTISLFCCGDVTVSAYTTVTAGLVVTPPLPTCPQCGTSNGASDWFLYHLPTGLAIARYGEPEAAQQAAARIGGLADWTDMSWVLDHDRRAETMRAVRPVIDLPGGMAGTIAEPNPVHP